MYWSCFSCFAFTNAWCTMWFSIEDISCAVTKMVQIMTKKRSKIHAKNRIGTPAKNRRERNEKVQETWIIYRSTRVIEMVQYFFLLSGNVLRFCHAFSPMNPRYFYSLSMAFSWWRVAAMTLFFYCYCNSIPTDYLAIF